MIDSVNALLAGVVDLKSDRNVTKGIGGWIRTIDIEKEYLFSAGNDTVVGYGTDCTSVI